MLIKLTKKICTAVEKELCGGNIGQEQYLNDLWATLQNEDKILAGSIKNFAAPSGDPAATIYACVIVWRLLEKQAQEDKDAEKTNRPCNGPYL